MPQDAFTVSYALADTSNKQMFSPAPKSTQKRFPNSTESGLKQFKSQKSLKESAQKTTPNIGLVRSDSAQENAYLMGSVGVTPQKTPVGNMMISEFDPTSGKKPTKQLESRKAALLDNFIQT
jgi:hypothetical protein